MIDTRTSAEPATTSNAQICRDRGWTPGTMLSAIDIGEPATVRITAVGVDLVLAQLLEWQGAKFPHPVEREWDLHLRDWMRLEDES